MDEYAQILDLTKKCPVCNAKDQPKKDEYVFTIDASIDPYALPGTDIKYVGPEREINEIPNKEEALILRLVHCKYCEHAMIISRRRIFCL